MTWNTAAQEQEFTARLDELGQDAVAAARFTYAAATIDHLRSRRPTLTETLDRAAGFWETVLGALQTAAISAVARIYDTDTGIMSADRVLQHAAAHSEALFSRLALQSRQARSCSARQAIEASADAHEPEMSDFAALRAQLDEHAALYESVIRPIRFELFTESGAGALLDTIALFQVAPRADFEKLALFPASLHAALRGLFDAGRKPVLKVPPADVAAMIASPPSDRNDAAWAQRHMVLEAWRFLTDLEDSGVSEQERTRRRGYED
jgi:hypothetical protein